MRLILVSLFLAALALPSRGEAASLRCGNKLASDGASMADVLARCGEPVSKDRRQTSTSTREKVKNRADAEETPTHSTTTVVTSTTTIEEWTYNFGANRLMQVAVFTDGRLTDVRSTGYGY